MADKLTIYKCDCFDVRQDVVIAVTSLLTEDELRDKWIRYRDELIEEQDTDISDFTRWNFYLFYVVQDKKKISRSLKYEIEHNTISSRKIVVDNEELNGDPKSLISKYIKFVIESGKNNRRLPIYQRNDKLMEILKKDEDKEG